MQILINNSNELTVAKQYKEFTLVLFFDKVSNFYVASARVNNKQVATATFANSKRMGGWCGTDISVDKKFRRLGIMNELYNWVEDSVGSKLVPTKTLTKDSKAFWAARLGN